MSTTPEVTIRPRHDDDLDELARILVEVYRRDGYPVEGVDNPHSWLNLDRPLGAWVAELDGNVVGHVALTEPGPHDAAPRIWAEKAGEPIEHTAVLGRLFLAPCARGCGLGALLTETATRLARRAGRTPVLDVMEKDAAAVRTYETLGWQRLGDVEHFTAQGRLVPAYTYVRPHDVQDPKEGS